MRTPFLLLAAGAVVGAGAGTAVSKAEDKH